MKVGNESARHDEAEKCELAHQQWLRRFKLIIVCLLSMPLNPFILSNPLNLLPALTFPQSLSVSHSGFDFLVTL